MVERKCHCGFRRGDWAIQEEPEYSTWGWILLSMFGMTPRPHHISFRCLQCRQEVGQSRDPRLLARRSLGKKDATKQAGAHAVASVATVAPNEPTSAQTRA